MGTLQTRPSLRTLKPVRTPKPPRTLPARRTPLPLAVAMMILSSSLSSSLFSILFSVLFSSLPATASTKKGAQTTPARHLPQAARPADAAGAATLKTRMAAAGAQTPHARHVMAVYYPWYQTLAYSRRWAHHDGVEPDNRRMVSHAHYPALGPYDSNDPKVIDRHLAQAEEAGIDTLVCSWWGRNDPTDRALRLLLSRAARRSIKICVLWEQVSPESRRTPEYDLTYLVQSFGKQPAYLRIDDRPVVFAFERVCHSFTPQHWAAVLDNIARQLAPGLFLMGEGETPAELCVWDGYYRLGAVTNQGHSMPEAAAHALHTLWEPTTLLARQLNRISVAVIAPGFDDRKTNRTGRPNMPLERRDGALYTALWRQAIADAPDWVLINSFNQWHNGTEIEPSVELGTTYLKLTARHAETFRHEPTSIGGL